MRTADLQGAQLDYWTARAEGVPADQLEIRRAVRPGDPRSPDYFCVRQLIGNVGTVLGLIRVDYSTNWALTGPLVEKHGVELTREYYGWEAWAPDSRDSTVIMREAVGDTLLIAICRAVVLAAFGDEVEDLPC